VLRELFEHLRFMKQQQWRITNYGAGDDVHKNYLYNELGKIGWTDKDINRLQDKECSRKRAYWFQGFWEFAVPLILVLWIGAILVCLAL
jgi:hypothetical protein